MKALTFRTKITSDKLTIEHLKNLLGKEVEIIIQEITQKLSQKKIGQQRKWKMSGKIKKGGYENINLRDLAYAENNG